MKALNRLLLLCPILCCICRLNPTLAQIHDSQRVFDCFLLFEQHSLKAQNKDIGWRIIGTRTELEGIDVDSNSVNYSEDLTSTPIPPFQIENYFPGNQPFLGMYYDTLINLKPNATGTWEMNLSESFKVFLDDGYPIIGHHIIDSGGRKFETNHWYWSTGGTGPSGITTKEWFNKDSFRVIADWEGPNIGNLWFPKKKAYDEFGNWEWKEDRVYAYSGLWVDSIRYSRYNGTIAFHDSAFGREVDDLFNIIRYSTYSYDSTILAWFPRKTIISEYEEDRPLLITEYIGNASGIPVKQTRFNYSNKRLMTIEEWKWDLTKTDWIPVANSIYQYSPSGKLESKANQYFESGTWKFKDKLDFESDGWGNVIQVRYYEMESGTWKHHLTHFYHYEAYSTKGMGLNPMMQELVIYPNPSVNKFTCKNPYAAKGILFVSSLDGKEMLQLDFSASEEIEVNHSLPPGMYVVVIDSEGKRYTDRLVVR